MECTNLDCDCAVPMTSLAEGPLLIRNLRPTDPPPLTLWSFPPTPELEGYLVHNILVTASSVEIELTSNHHQVTVE
jgi:hypothetical protein